MDSRKRMGKDKDGVIFPVAPNLSEMSDSYLDFIEAIKKEIENQRLKVVLNANSSMICLYWNIGKAILQKQEEEGWGAKVIDRMAKDLKDAFPDMSGFSPRNIKYMRKFAECWPDFEIVQRVVAQIPWRTNRRDFALKNKNPCSACEFQAKQGISIWGIKLLFFSV